jgi:hypothetical protein
MQQAMKRVFVWFIEVLAEALLLGCLLGALLSSQIGLRYGVIGSILAVPVVLFLHGYYLTRAIAGVVCMTKGRWLYPVVAAGLFVAHVYFAFAQSKSALSPEALVMEPFFLVGGACVVFGCAFVGGYFLRRWERAGSSQ